LIEMRRLLPVLVTAVALALAPAGADRAWADAGCTEPPEALEAAPLPGTSAAIARGKLRILAVGSASVTASVRSPEANWPERLQAALQQRLGQTGVEVKSFGGRGTTAADHARILAAEVPRFRPHLVVWQLGTVEAARGLPAEDMSDVVQETAATLRAERGERTDLILMDMQFSRFFRANANVELYRDQLRVAAAASGAQLFSRWNVMMHWADTDQLDLERAPREEQRALLQRLHSCLADALASFILDGARRSRQ
jgi:acyl-CoA thioesterase I